MRGVWLLATGALLLGGCHRASLPPRPDGAAVVITADAVDDGIATLPESEPDDTLGTAQHLAVAPATPAAIAGTLEARPPSARRDVDLYRIDVPGPDAGAAPPPPPRDAAVMVPAPRFLLRAELRPSAGLAVTMEALDGTGRSLVAAPGQPGEAIAIPNLAAQPGTTYLRIRAAGAEATAGAASYRLVVRLVPFDTGAEIEPNSDAVHATDLALGGEAVGYLGWRRDQDWYRLSTAGIADGSVVSADLDPIPEVGAALQLYGADGHTKLTEARGRKGERVVLRNVRIPASDRFLFLVVRADSGWSADARYNLRPRADLPKAGTEAEPNDDPAHAQAITDGTVQGYLARGDVDFFRYSTTGMALLDLEVVPPEHAGVEVEVTREDGSLLARAASGRLAPARITGQPIPGGPILIRVIPRKGPVNADDPYRLTLASRPPGAPAAPAPPAE